MFVAASGAKLLVRAPPSRTGCSGAGAPAPRFGDRWKRRAGLARLEVHWVRLRAGLSGCVERRHRLPFILPRCRRIGRPVGVGRRLFKRRTRPTGKRRNLGPLPRLIALWPFLGHACGRASSAPSFCSRNDFSTSGFSGLGQPHPVGKGPPAGRVISEVFFLVNLVDRIFLIAGYALPFDRRQLEIARIVVPAPAPACSRSASERPEPARAVGSSTSFSSSPRPVAIDLVRLRDHGSEAVPLLMRP